MAGRLLNTLAKMAPSTSSPSMHPHAVEPMTPFSPPLHSFHASARASTCPQDGLVMDIFNRHKHHQARKKDKAENPEVASMDMRVESPPLVFYHGPGASSGALLSGQLIISVHEPWVAIDRFEMRLLSVFSPKKPVGAHCPDCSIQETEIHKWSFLTQKASLYHGSHSFPYSHLLPGRLPATSHGGLASLDYCLSAVAITCSGQKISYRRCLDVKRAIIPGSEKHFIRLFPPTNFTISLTQPSVIHPIGKFGMEMRLSGIIQNGSTCQTRWRLHKLNWCIEEMQTAVVSACSKHASKAGRGSSGTMRQNTRVIASEEVKTGWKSDWEKGEVDVEFEIGCDLGSTPLCDMESALDMTVKHRLIIDAMVAEECAPLKSLSQAKPSGLARVLRAQFSLVVTERAGLGISWDQEQPPVYEDVPASPPAYAHDRTPLESSCGSSSAYFAL